MTDFDFSIVTKGDKLTLRCGGVVVVREVTKTDSQYYPIGIRLEGFHAALQESWIYDDKGENGNGTGPDDVGCPFDIIKLEREALEMWR